MLKFTAGTRLLALLALASFPVSVASGAVALSDLIANQSTVIVGELAFDQFGYDSTGGMPSVNSISVDNLSTNDGIRFAGPWFVSSANGPSTATISYRVSSFDPALALSGASMAGNPAVINAGLFRITEQLMEASKSLVIFDQVPGLTSLVDSTDFNTLLSEIDVDLVFDAVPGSSMAAGTVSFVDQQFSQGVVPEPASVVVWLGMVLLVGVVPYVYRRYMPVPADNRT